MAVGLKLASCTFCGRGLDSNPPLLVLAIDWKSEEWTAADIVIPDCSICYVCLKALHRSLEDVLVLDSEGVWFKASGTYFKDTDPILVKKAKE